MTLSLPTTRFSVPDASSGLMFCPPQTSIAPNVSVFVGPVIVRSAPTAWWDDGALPFSVLTFNLIVSGIRDPYASGHAPPEVSIYLSTNPTAPEYEEFVGWLSLRKNGYHRIDVDVKTSNRNQLGGRFMHASFFHIEPTSLAITAWLSVEN